MNRLEIGAVLCGLLGFGMCVLNVIEHPTAGYFVLAALTLVVLIVILALIRFAVRLRR